MSLRTEVRKIAKRITKLYMIEIGKKELIDTGNLQRSFKTKINVSKDGEIDIDVSSIYYFQYLDGPFDVSEDVLKSKEYKRVEDILIGLIISERFTNIDKEFDSSDSVSYTFKFQGFGK